MRFLRRHVLSFSRGNDSVPIKCSHSRKFLPHSLLVPPRVPAHAHVLRRSLGPRLRRTVALDGIVQMCQFLPVSLNFFLPLIGRHIILSKDFYSPLRVKRKLLLKAGLASKIAQLSERVREKKSERIGKKEIISWLYVVNICFPNFLVVFDAK